MRRISTKDAHSEILHTGLTFKQIVWLCGAVLLLVTLAGLIWELTFVPMGAKVGLVIAIFLVILVVFPWLWRQRNPNASMRRRAGMYLIMGGFTLISSLLFAGFEVEIDIFGYIIAFKLLLQGEWWVDVVLGLTPIFMFFLGYLLLRLPAQITIGPEVEPEEIETTDESDLEYLASYSPPSRPVFWVRVRQLFELKSFNRYREFGDLNEADCIVGMQEEDEGYRTVVIRCDDRGELIQKEDVEQLMIHARRVADKSRNDRELRIFYVVPHSDVLTQMDQAEFPTVVFKTEDTLLDELVRFEPYLRKLKNHYEVDKLPYSLLEEEEQKTLAQTYVQPRFSLSDGVWDDSLDAYIDQWLAEPGARHLALLGDYGMGKTSFVTYLAAKQAKAWLEGDHTVRIPILLKLGGASPRNDPRAKKLLSVFNNDNRLGTTDEALRHLMREGRILVILDGFDEMDLIGDIDQRRRHFEELWSLAEHGNKVMISGRPGYFPNSGELSRILRVADRMAKQGTGARYCTRINLEPFEPEDIKESFFKYFGDRETATQYLASVYNHKELMDLARRPALMHIIRDTLSVQAEENIDLVEEEVIMKPVALLRTYTEHWLVRDKEKPRHLLIEDEVRLRFSKELAAWMLKEDLAEVTSENLLQQYEEWFPDDPKLTGNLQKREGLEADLRTCTFMVPVGDKSFKFAHMPFLEYFVAAWLVDHLTGDRQDEPLPIVFRSTTWRHEIARHVADLLLENNAPDEISKILKEKVYGWGMGEFWGDLWARFQREQPSVATAQAEGANISAANARLFNMTQIELYAGVPFIHTVFFRIRRFRLISWLPSMVHSMLSVLGTMRMLKAIDYSGADLSGAALRGADLRGAILNRANLIRADLSDANLIRANLIRADLRWVNLLGADLRWVNLLGADLSEANLNGANLSEANLREADLSEAHFFGTNLSGADLREANLIRANLIRADLREANLIRANLIRADLRVANLSEANLSGADLRWANLSEANLSGANLIRADLREADLIGADLNEAYLSGADLRKAALCKAVLLEADLLGADLSEADLSGADLSGADLRGADLSGADLRGANLNVADLNEADFSGADLRGAMVTQEQLSWLSPRAHFGS